MRARRAVRTVGAVALLAPMTGALFLGAPPAYASGGTWLTPTPSSETIFSSGSSVTVKGQINEGTSSQATLKLVAPSEPSDPSISWSCPSNWDGNALRSSPCARSLTLSFTKDGAPRPNGRWTATLSDGSLSRSFYTNFAPATPSGLSASGKGASQVDLSWSYAGAEPDLTGFVISDDKGNTFNVDDPSARSYTALYSNPEPGTYDYSFTVKARRSSCGVVCGGSTVSGDSSSPASAQLVTPQPPPSPTPGPTTGGTTGGTTTGTTGGTTGGSTGTTTTGGTTGGTTGTTTTGGTTGGTTGKPGATTGKAKPVFSIPTLAPQVAQRRAFALGFNSFSPSLGIPKLPPLPATKFPVTAPDDEGFEATLPYKSEKQVTATDVFTDPVGAVTNLDSAQLAKMIAVALILMLTAAHVRRFLGETGPS
jgi:hypothetical protein